MQAKDRHITREQQTIAAMLRLYCRGVHGNRGSLCPECAQLLGYASRRLDNCPFEGGKPACNQCRIHCYSTAMRGRIRTVMRHAGPRMLYRHPILGILHLLDRLRPAPVLARRRAGAPLANGDASTYRGNGQSSKAAEE